MFRAIVFLSLLVAGVLVWGVVGAAAAAGPAFGGSVANAVSLSGATYVAVSGNYAYTATFYPGTLTVVDISNPVAPQVVGQSPFASSLLNGSAVAVSGSYAYVVSQNRNKASSANNNDDGTGNSLTILDISVPTAPKIVGTLHDSNLLFGAHGVVVSGSYVYVAAQGCLVNEPCPNASVGNSFVVIDVSNPASPTIVASLQNASLPSQWAGSGALWHACGIAVSGRYAYVTASYANRLTIIDILDPLHPAIAGSLPDSTQLPVPVDVAVAGGYAFVANEAISNGRVTVVDVRNAAFPQVAGAIVNSALNGAYRIRIRNNFAYVAASYSPAMSVLDISDPANPRLAGSFSSTALLNRTVGIDLDPTSRYAISISPFLSTESRIKFPPFPLQPGGPTNTGTVTAITLDPLPISVTINAASKPANPTTQASASFTFATSDAISTVRCQLDSAPLSLCTSPTSQTYSSLPLGSHTFTVQAIDAAGNTATDSYTWTINPNPPVNQSPPLLSGAAVQGQSLTVTAGSWSGAPTLSEQWQRCNSNGANCTNITGATGTSYLLAAADVGSRVRVNETAINSAGSASTASTATAVVTGQASAPVNQSPPLLSGAAVQGQTLTVTAGVWSGSPVPTLAEQWQRCDSGGANCTDITGATGTSYLLAAADVGSTIRVNETATNTAGSAQTASAATGVVAADPRAPSTPVLDNFNRANGGVGANWSMIKPTGFAAMNVAGNAAVDSSTSAYAWNYWKTASFGPDSEAYVTVSTLGAADVIRIGARVTGGGGSSPSGYYVSVSAGAWSILRIDNGGSPVTLASGVTQTLASGDQLAIRIVGSVVSALHYTSTTGWLQVLTYNTSTDSTRYTAAGNLALEFKTSTLDNFGGGTISAAAAPVNQSPPTLSGTAQQGQTLTVTAGVWSGSPVPTLAEQWQRCDSGGANCTDITGATGTSYLLAAADVGSTIRVNETATNSAGNATTPSTTTTVVSPAAAAPVNQSPPTLSGTAQQGQTLTVTAGVWSGSPVPTLAEQWQRCDSGGANCTDITGATGTSYLLAAADVGSTIRVNETATNSAGNATTPSTTTTVVSPAAAAPVNQSPPTLSGTAQQGQTLTVTAGVWSGSPVPTLAEQWQRCDSGGANCTDITGATGTSYLLAAADVGSTIRVNETATNSAGNATTPSTTTTVVSPAAAAPVNQSPPTLSGTAQQGQTLTVTAGVWSGSPVPTLAEQWQRCDSGGANCTDITGATGTSYLLAAADVGSTIRVNETATNSAGSASTASTSHRCGQPGRELRR